MLSISMAEVESSNIQSIGYSKENSILQVEFKNKSSYLYIGVSETLWLKFSKADSIGSALHKYILSNKELITVNLQNLDLLTLFKQLLGLSNHINNGVKQFSNTNLKMLVASSGIVSESSSSTLKTKRRKIHKKLDREKM